MTEEIVRCVKEQQETLYDQNINLVLERCIFKSTDRIRKNPKILSWFGISMSSKGSVVFMVQCAA